MQGSSMMVTVRLESPVPPGLPTYTFYIHECGVHSGKYSKLGARQSKFADSGASDLPLVEASIQRVSTMWSAYPLVGIRILGNVDCGWLSACLFKLGLVYVSQLAIVTHHSVRRLEDPTMCVYLVITYAIRMSILSHLLPSSVLR